MRELTGGDRAWDGYQALLRLEGAIAAQAWPSLLQPIRSRGYWADRFTASALEREAWESFVERPLGEAIERHVQDDVLRGLLLTDGKIGVFGNAHDPSLIQNRCFLYHVIGQGTGEWRVPVGGMRTLVDGLVQRATDGHARIEENSPVLGVHDLGKRHAVVFEQDGREHTVDADRVLVNAGPRTFARLFGREYAPIATDEGSVMKVNMLLRRLPRLRAPGVTPAEAFAGSFHVDEGYAAMETSYRQAEAGALPDLPPFETYCHTLTDDSILSPALRADGYQTLTLFGLDAPYRLFAKDDEERKEEMQRPLPRGDQPDHRGAVRGLPGARQQGRPLHRDQVAAGSRAGTRPRPGQHLPQLAELVLHGRSGRGRHLGRRDRHARRVSLRIVGVARWCGERGAGLPGGAEDLRGGSGAGPRLSGPSRWLA